MEPKIFVGNNLLEELYKRQSRRNRMGLRRTQVYRDLCVQARVSAVQLGRWLNNVSQPDLGQAFACAQVLGVSVDELCHFEQPAQ